jgi:hypothetical protein
MHAADGKVKGFKVSEETKLAEANRLDATKQIFSN